MSGRITVWGAGQLLTSYFGKTVTPPPTLYVALVRTIAPTPYISGGELDEPDNTDYARAPIDNDLAHWSNISQPQEIANVMPVQFITASSDWGQVQYWALCNADKGGYNVIVGELENPVLISSGDQPRFETGDLSASLGPFFLADEV